MRRHVAIYLLAKAQQPVAPQGGATTEERPVAEVYEDGLVTPESAKVDQLPATPESGGGGSTFSDQ